MGNLSESVSVRFEPDVLKHLKTMARRESAARDQDITWSDLIRESVLQVYPMPKNSVVAGQSPNLLSVLDFAKIVLRIELTPGQTVLLKALFGGSAFNEHLSLDESDLALIRDSIPDGTTNATMAYLSDLSTNTSCKIRLGRRGGKTLISSLIAAYELYRANSCDSRIGYLHSHNVKVLREFLYVMAKAMPERNIRISGGDLSFEATMLSDDKTCRVKLIGLNALEQNRKSELAQLSVLIIDEVDDSWSVEGKNTVIQFVPLNDTSPYVPHLYFMNPSSSFALA